MVALDEAGRADLRRRYADWSGQGYRVLGVAARRVGAQTRYEPADETGLASLGYLLFLDPPKPGVRETIARLANLGVRLKIITGDNRLVAAHTAQSIGLAAPRILTGATLETLRDEALWHQAEKTDIFRILTQSEPKDVGDPDAPKACKLESLEATPSYER